MMFEKTMLDFTEELSSSRPVPGGGGASAAVGAFAAALGMMVTNLTIGKKKYGDVEEEIRKVREELEILKQQLIYLTNKDAEAFEPLSRAYVLPKETEEEKEIKEKIMEKALYDASIVPMEIMETILKIMELLKILGEKGSKIAISDVGVAVLFAEAALEGASLNVFINTKLMKDERQAFMMNSKTKNMVWEGQLMKEKVYKAVFEKIQ